MIDKLVSLYDIVPGLAPMGWSTQNVRSVMVLRPDGSVERVRSLGERGQRIVVPAPMPHSNKCEPFCLVDTATYFIGHKNEQNKVKRVDIGKHATESAKFHKELPDSIYGAKPVQLFLELIAAGNIPFTDDQLKQLVSGMIAFQAAGEVGLIHESEEFKAWWDSRPDKVQWWEKDSKTLKESRYGQCVVTGEYGVLSRTHPKIKGIIGTQPAGGSVSSVNVDAGESYGLDQCYVGGMTAKTVNRYSESLNWLLAYQRICIGSSTFVWWTTAADSKIEVIMHAIFGGHSNVAFESDDDETSDEGIAGSEDVSVEGVELQDDGLVEQGRKALEAIRNGQLPTEGDAPVYILGMDSAIGRISITFWSEMSLGELYKRIGNHISAMGEGAENVKLTTILAASKPSADRKPAPYGRSLAQAVIDGTQYPIGVVMDCMSRHKAEGHMINEGRHLWRNKARVAMFRAWLFQQEGNVMNESAGYQFGRVTAISDWVSEKVLRRPSGAYTSMMQSPASVVASLRQITQIRLGRIKSHWFREYALDQLSDSLGRLPQEPPLDDDGMHPWMVLEPIEQMRFAIGYDYQANRMRNDIADYRKSNDNVEIVVELIEDDNETN